MLLPVACLVLPVEEQKNPELERCKLDIQDLRDQLKKAEMKYHQDKRHR